MVKKHLLGLIVPIVALATGVSSCSDYDNGLTEKDIQYAQNFRETFGEIDPNQDWSMAASVTANVSVGGGETEVLVYSENPLIADNTFLGVIKGNKSVINTVKGAKQVYAIINVNGKKAISGYYNIEGGSVTFSDTPVAKNMRKTRAGSATCSPYDGDADGTEDGIIYFDRVKNYLNATGTVPCPIQWRDGTTEAQKTTCDAGFDYDLYASASFENMGSKEIHNFYIVNEPDFSQKVERKLYDMYDLFYEYETKSGTKKEGVFHEGTNHVKPYMGKSVTESDGLSKDAYFITKGGEPVTMTLVGKGTNKKNNVGYFYYPKAQEANYMRADGKTLDFDKVKKFVLITDASNTHDLLDGPNAYRSDEHIVYDTYGKFQDAVGKAGAKADGSYWDNGVQVPFSWGDATYNCTVVTFPYFGDGENPASETTDFPADYVIGFFMINPTVGSGTLDHIVCSFANVELNYFNDYPRGAAFKYLGKTYLGIEDDFDYDINDYVFEIGGVKDDDVPDITPEDHKYYSRNEERAWMFACEDLGGSFDYDFNDVVFEFVQKYKVSGEVGVGGSTTEFMGAYVRILAAGGTLPASIIYDSTPVGGKEIHQLFGQPESEKYTPVNVHGTRPTISPIEIKLEDITEPIEDVNTIKGLFSILVTGNDGDSFYVKAPNQGEAPQVILLPSGWDWPTEGTPITAVYTDFEHWTESMEENGWISNKSGSFITNPNKDGGIENEEEGGGNSPTPTPAKESSDLTIASTSASIILSALGTEASATIDYTTSSTGEITISTSNNEVSATCDPSTKKITITTSSVVSGVTITLSQAEDGNYNASENKTIIVTSMLEGSHAAITLGGEALTISDYTFSRSYGEKDFEYTIDKRYFEQATKVTVELTSRSSTKLNASVIQDGLYNAKDNASHTIEITSTEHISRIKNEGLKIIDWAIPYPDNCDKVASISITVE
ncbi:MAG: DUF4842 domain-containing protein [Prevotellaceae bacterium]|nr:DUF4842 domain-containing protein [Candidatus Minthosoma caballi]